MTLATNNLTKDPDGYCGIGRSHLTRAYVDHMLRLDIPPEPGREAHFIS